MLAAEDLPGLAREFEQRAARGDVDAALALRDLVSDCDDARSSADPAGRPLFESLGALGEPHVAWMQFSLAYWEGILPACERLFGEVANWPDQIRAPAIERAAVLGDPGARLQHSHLTNDDSRRNALRELLLEGDPHQWMRYSIWMAPHTLLEDGMVQSTAFFWAGCTRIPACATDPAAYVYDFATPNGSLGARWNQAMSFWDSPRWRAIAQAQALRINELLAVGRIDSLLPPEPMPRRP